MCFDCQNRLKQEELADNGAIKAAINQGSV